MLLELIMIVRNSGNVLRKCLQAIKPYINSWTILDTGSTDNTPEIITEELKDVEGTLHYAEFIDFSTSRNRAFDLSNRKCKYQIILDDSYVLHGGDKLLELLASSNADSYSIKIGTLSDEKIFENYYYSMRIVKTSVNARYVGKVHEVIVIEMKNVKNEFLSETINENPKIFIDDLPDKLHSQRSKKRFETDVKLLEEEIEENKNNNNIDRTIYHLARTYEILENYPKAMLWWNKLVKISKKPEYYFAGVYNGARIDFICNEDSKTYNNPDIFLKNMMILYTNFPDRRAESGFRIAIILNERQEYLKLDTLLSQIITLKHPELYLTVVDGIIYYYNKYLYVENCIKLGKYEIAVEHLKKLLDQYPTHRTLLNMKYALCEPDMSKIIKFPQKVLVIHMGDFFYTWNPQNNTDISGSEYVAINLANEFVKYGFRVFMFGIFEGKDKNGKEVNYECTIKGIQFIDSEKYENFISNYHIDYLIASRRTSNLVYYDNIDNVYLWLHDIIPINMGLPFQINPKKFKGVITLTKWHKNFVKNRLGISEKFMIESRNAIDIERFNCAFKEKIPYRFIYISDPFRGLDNMPSLISRIKKEYPKTTLRIFTRYNDIQKDTLEKLKQLDYVEVFDRVDQKRIAEELLCADVFLYPCTFMETYCISALEAMASKTLVATVNYAGLGEICTNKSVLIPYPYNEDAMCKKLFFTLNNETIKQNIIQKAYDWAINQTYENLSKDWLKFLTK